MKSRYTYESLIPDSACIFHRQHASRSKHVSECFSCLIYLHIIHKLSRMREGEKAAVSFALDGLQVCGSKVNADLSLTSPCLNTHAQAPIHISYQKYIPRQYFTPSVEGSRQIQKDSAGPKTALCAPTWPPEPRKPAITIVLSSGGTNLTVLFAYSGLATSLWKYEDSAMYWRD